MQAWEAYRAVAIEPACDPIRQWGNVHAVESAGFLFEAVFSPGWPSGHGQPSMPEHYAQVEASPAFMIPMTRHLALAFSFGVVDIG